MAKNIGKKISKNTKPLNIAINEYKDKTKHLAILFTFFGIFRGLWYWIVKFIFDLSLKRTDYYTLDDYIYIYFLLFITYFIFRYILLIIRVIYYQTCFEGNNKFKFIFVCKF